MHSNGYVGLRADKIFGNANTRFICNVRTEFNNVSVETCKVIAAKLMTKEANGEEVTIEYNDELTCKTQPHATSSSPVVSIL